MIRLTGHGQFIKYEKLFQRIQLFALYLLPWSLLFSEAATSVLVIVFSVPLIFFGGQIDLQKNIRWSWPYYMIYGLIFVSGFWSSDTVRWLSLLRVNLPYLVMPLAFGVWDSFLRQFSGKIFNQFFLAGTLLSLYIFYLAMSRIGVGADIASGGYLPVPVHHVRTGLFLAVAALAGWEQISRYGPGKYYSHLWMMLILLAGIHLLAVRTGIVLMYIGSVLYFLLEKSYRGRKGWIALGIMVALFAAVFLTSPTLSEKLNYWKEDWQNLSGHSWAFYSDAMRWKSNVTGWQIFRENVWFGAGMGDVRNEMTLQFLQQEKIYTEHYPHNLWITMMAGTGLVGLLATNFSLGVLGFRQWKSGPFGFVIFLIFIGSCLVENTLLSSVGTIGFVLVSLLAERENNF